jgi:hypothetical protein
MSGVVIGFRISGRVDGFLVLARGELGAGVIKDFPRPKEFARLSGLKVEPDCSLEFQTFEPCELSGLVIGVLPIVF